MNLLSTSILFALAISSRFLRCAIYTKKGSRDRLPGDPETFCDIDIREPVSAQNPEFKLFFTCWKKHM
ncbi:MULTISPECIES: hypothetical protein [Methanosarcina]|uniref:Uncharacterized protein n=1 Tax=Methanosarcina vacuolata Z-761 TaxID=1434123 RepID=A0A0E3Q1Q4_9EURY|nr:MULTISPECIES: hypothetical protein [Methanosarcina]AKB42388.1 hypothetical protein MSVAZ_0119 [Methanosarcina vacuolata Z-761]AKB45892.1 hypothetical protein MSKOL_0115 [Methanosarcina sp. Kolksee]